ncbi:MAG TPA: hypothetical protein VLT88_03300, partial [Desulfosarcina sp.]|nr:hypothetical protein [Desulfosarcina sp.]
AGIAGYIVARMWIRPIFRYNLLKRRLDHELGVYLALTGHPPGSRSEGAENRGAPLRRARKHAMDLVGCYSNGIPYWYRLLLDSRGESPLQASGMLTNLAKIQNREQIEHRIDQARQYMRLR